MVAVVAGVDLVDLDLDRVRDLLERPPQDLLADELGEHDVLGLVRAVLGREQERPLGHERREVLAQRPHPLARAGGDREDVLGDARARAASRAPARVRPRSIRSTLLTATTTGTPAPRRIVAMKRSPGPMPCTPLTTNSAASESASSLSTRRCMRSVSASRGRWTPGRSTSTSWWSAVVATPRIARRVVCGLSETIATFRPTRPFTSVDLPTFGRPASATKPGAGDAGRPAHQRQELRLEREHLAVVRLVVHAGEVQRAVDDGFAQVLGVLGADDDVAQLARARRRRPLRRSGTTARRSDRSCRGGPR